jgi:starch synthase
MPIITSTSRVVFQKGFQIFLEILEPLLKLDLQIIIMGDGQKEYIDVIKKFHKKHKKKIVWLPFNSNKKLETLIYAGSDIFILPSHHEPCGINQLIAMRYGCIPVVRSVGGLNDTVNNYNPKTRRGNGFSFNSFNPYSFYGTIIRALENYNHEKKWRSLVSKAMKESNSWEIPAKKYINLYKKTIKNNL